MRIINGYANTNDSVEISKLNVLYNECEHKKFESNFQRYLQSQKKNKTELKGKKHTYKFNGKIIRFFFNF